MMIGTKEAARLLKICSQGVRRLLKEGRIVGAKKVGRFWQIPLFNGIPKIIEGKRGPKGTWRKRLSKALTRITVNQQVIRSNKKNHKHEPVVRIQSGNHITYSHDVEIAGSCRVVYSPVDTPRSKDAGILGSTSPLRLHPLRNLIQRWFSPRALTFRVPLGS